MLLRRSLRPKARILCVHVTTTIEICLVFENTEIQEIRTVFGLPIDVSITEPWPVTATFNVTLYTSRLPELVQETVYCEFGWRNLAGKSFQNCR